MKPSVSSSTACTKPPAEDLESKKDSSAAGAKELGPGLIVTVNGDIVSPQGPSGPAL